MVFYNTNSFAVNNNGFGNKVQPNHHSSFAHKWHEFRDDVVGVVETGAALNGLGKVVSPYISSLSRYGAPLAARMGRMFALSAPMVMEQAGVELAASPFV
jgi:hypothetical protein